MNEFIEVKYVVHGTTWHINEALKSLESHGILSLDIETKGVYARKQRAEALKLLDQQTSTELHKLASIVANNSGLSYPSLVNVTHFVFGLSKDKSVILIVSNEREELNVWKWVSKFNGLLVIHNTLFDLKIMYHRIRCLPKYYDDTALMAKTLINNSNNWKSKVALKELMGSHYSPEWTLIDEYEPDNPRDPKFLRYTAIDGASTLYLYELLQERFNK
jgi:hypothetical protein